jgi:uncharacterized protein (DUF1501 family)
MITRRNLLQGLMLAGGYALLPFGNGWTLAAPEAAQKHFIMIFMRGAVDGLSVVTPYMEPYYYQARPNIALAQPGQTNGLINLDGFFGLNPNLASLTPLWQNRSLAFIHASGSVAETRSHFEAQDIMETAMLNSALASQGWMNKLAQMLPSDRSPTQMLSFGNTLPKIFQGRYDVATVPVGLHNDNKMNANAIVGDPHLQAELGQMYAGRPELGGLYQQALSARATEVADLQTEMQTAGQGAPPADAFVKLCDQCAGMVHKDRSIQLVFMDVGGWDTHVNQGNAKGQLANRLEKLGQGLATLAQGLGDAYRDTTIMVMSEFGRTVAQNGNGGTDHGHGNVAWLLGGGVKGGKVYSRWPGLNPDKLWQQRDLAVTTDFRSILGAALAGNFGLDVKALRSIIPNYQPDNSLNGIIG